jgi:hypothetical protein
MKYVKLFENWLNEADSKKLPDQDLPDLAKFEKSFEDAIELAKTKGIGFARDKKDDEKLIKDESKKIAKSLIKTFYPKMEWSKDTKVSLKQEDEYKSIKNIIDDSALTNNLGFSMFWIINSWLDAEKRIMNFEDIGKEKDAEELKEKLNGDQTSALNYAKDVIKRYKGDNGKTLLADAYGTMAKDTVPQNYADIIGNTKPQEMEPPKPLTAPGKGN